MRPLLACLLLTTAAVPLLAQSAPQRPSITGIAFVRFAISDPAAEETFFAKELGYEGYLSDPAAAANAHRININARQFIETVVGPPVQTTAGPNRLLAVGLQTGNVAAMRAYLAAHGVAPLGPIEDHRLTVHDPEGNTIIFTNEMRATPLPPKSDHALSHRIIHAGFVVQSESKENSFYRDVLGFKPYWHGGRVDGETDYVSQQVPDGTDWIEYMLNVKPDANAASRGVSNHVSLGVEHMGTAVAQLKANGCDTKECTASQMGRDGKVQLNLYDPDHTRVEVMEFTPTGPVCCSPYTGRMPSAKDPL